MKNIFKFVFLLVLFIPVTVFAYSEYLIASGRNIGIELKTNGVLIVGSYKIENYDALLDSDLKLGDIIIKVNDKVISNAKDFQKEISKINENIIKVYYIRNGNEYNTNINLFNDDGIYKTGFYVKDGIKGVGTLTYIEPSNKENGYKNTFGALGHEITEKSTKKKFITNSGTIFNSIVTGITKSSTGSPGEKNARSNSSQVIGKVNKNSSSGVFGIYTETLPKDKMYKVAMPDDVREGKAQILTTIDGSKISSFNVNIVKINKNSKTKNILFEIIDKELLDKTGGIVQGMSGSPIIQGDYIIGAVNYVLVDSPKNGYGIFITNMLDEANN